MADAVSHVYDEKMMADGPLQLPKYVSAAVHVI
jgi:hypothetical protein